MADGLVGENWVQKFQDRIATYCGVEQAVPTNSGTSALHLALLAAGVKPNDEVLVPSLTFAATANAVSYLGATPHFIDGGIGANTYKLRRHLEQNTTSTPDRRGRLNPKTGRVISCVVAVDLLGFPADLTRLEGLADEFGLIFIEDAAEALGSIHSNRRCGSFGAASTISFNNNKIITGNGGGVVLTDDPALAATAWHYSRQARTGHPWKVEHDAIAFNYRMSNLTASVICAQLDRIEEFIAAKKKLLTRYKEAFAGCDALEVLEATKPHHGEPNYWLISVRLTPRHIELRDEILNGLHERGIQARALFTPLHKQDPYKDFPRQPNMGYSEDEAARVFCLPSGVGLVQ